MEKSTKQQVKRIVITDDMFEGYEPIVYKAQRYNIGIQEKDLITLKPRNWLNDQIINFQTQFFKEIYEKSSKNKQNFAILDSLVVEQLKNAKKHFERIVEHSFHKKLIDKKGLKGSVFNNYERIFFIVNERGNHWIFVEIKVIKIDLNKKQFDIIIYDSGKQITHSGIDLKETKFNIDSKQYIDYKEKNKNPEEKKPYKKNTLLRIFDKFDCLEILTDVVLIELQKYEENIQIDNLNFTYEWDNVPQQDNMEDCGVFTLFFAYKCLIEGKSRQQLQEEYDEYIDIKKNRQLLANLVDEIGMKNNGEQIDDILDKYKNIYSQM